jgi:hypothetical protein
MIHSQYSITMESNPSLYSYILTIEVWISILYNVFSKDKNVSTTDKILIDSFGKCDENKVKEPTLFVFLGMNPTIFKKYEIKRSSTIYLFRKSIILNVI